MPKAAPSPCRHRGCRVLVRDGSGLCEAHRKQVQKEADEKRGSSASRGYDSKWRRARESYLREHPLCVECRQRGFIEAATVVDHITPHKGDQKLFWSRSNWQSLCKPCHDRKTATEDGGFGNPRRGGGGG
ncbi:HNH endonuclease [Pseudogulbenkiania ferrooxidans]|uniref:Putative HNH nuclease YajD n=1 Tax=Pseudogulbenkiania ferrooxidans 2002 TaxID=279714 RepID=B9YYT6_9NEIS|nr:HNH endonuclease signature motif containing protein [Pseudogulbenkiania ferrooxidans]EEG10289.1 HNH endonuclease [Pseudogulbenkiania ferrooxidans 2002]